VSVLVLVSVLLISEARLSALLGEDCGGKFPDFSDAKELLIGDDTFLESLEECPFWGDPLPVREDDPIDAAEEMLSPPACCSLLFGVLLAQPPPPPLRFFDLADDADDMREDTEAVPDPFLLPRFLEEADFPLRVLLCDDTDLLSRLFFDDDTDALSLV